MNHQLITQREQEVLQLVAHEYTTPQIANRLYLSRHTVDSHKKNLKTKLAVKNAAGMVRRGFELGLLKMMSQQVNLVIILLATITFSITSVNAQQEVELRADGIVVPRTTTSNVTSPTTGMIIYDNNVEAFMYFNGSVWSVVGGGAFERVNGNVRPASPKAETDSFEFGSGRANGESSIAFGVEASADTTYAVAIGHGTTASGLGSIALGNNVTARGTSSFAAGSYNLVSGAYAASLGSENSASGDNAFTFGNFTYATQAASTAFGTFSRADADNATAFGQETQASGPRSTAFGNRTSASGEGATAFGQYSEARGNISTAFGLGVIAHGLGSTVVGTYNDTLVTVSSDDTDRPLFLVGNGTAGIVNGIWVEDRNNALVVRQNGQVEFDNYTFPIDDGISNQVMTSDGSGQLSWTTLADNDPNNEKQSLALSGNLLTLSNGGGNANLAYLDDWNTSSDGNSIYFNVGQGGDLGNVGIGTINPDARLEVYANGSSVANPTLELKEDNNNKFVHQAFSNRFATEKWLLKAKPKDTNSSSSAAFNFSYSEGNKNIMSLKGDGSVGIGMESTFDNTLE